MENITRSLLALQDTMLNALTSNTSLADTMYMLCSEVERLAPEVRSCVIRLDGQLMRPLAAPSMPEAYNAALEGFAIGPHVGACGVSMTYGRSVMTTDIATDPNWVALRALVLPMGLGVCWSHPIKARDGKVLGSMAFYYTPGGRPTEFHHELVKNCLNLCSLAFEHEAAQHNIQRHAFFDNLTGLPNRAMLIREAQRTLDECAHADSRFSLLFVDLDGLKPINDAWGHMVGDAVLRRAAEIFRSRMRDTDIVGRLGGDEFLVVVRHHDTAEVQDVASRLLHAFDQPLDLAPIHHETVQISVSIGVASYPQDAPHVEMLLDLADKAMYRAKALGKKSIQYAGDSVRKKAGAAASKKANQSPQPAQVQTPCDKHDELKLYGERVREHMSQLRAAMKPRLRDIVERFYEHIPEVAGASYLLSYLSPDELQHLKRQMTDHVGLLSSPDLDYVTHEETALHLGHLHAQVGLTRDAIATSCGILNALVHESVEAREYVQGLAIFAQRLLRDLTWQLVVAQQVQLMYSSVLTKITDLAWKARSYTELIASAAEIVGSLPGVAGCAFLHPDARGVSQVEALTGANMREFYADVVAHQRASADEGTDSTGSNPSLWAWRSGVIARCFNFHTDPRMAIWRPIAAKWGFRSCITIPLGAPKEQTASSVLAVYNNLPGGFSSQEQDMFFSQIQSLLVFGINRLQAWRIASEAVPFAVRERWSQLLKKRDGLIMHYQPVMDLRTGDITKVEALARLHDDGILLTPHTFFPALSQQDFLLLYENGLNQILAHRQQWLEQGWTLDISVNLPNAALENDLYIDITSRTLKRHDCPPTALTLEILEADEVAQNVNLLDVLSQYKKLGLHLAEDDLGKGYSSLARLRTMPFDVIKIDRSIVSQVESNPYSTLRFIHQLTRLGHGLGRQVVVEGIETVELLEACVILGVDHGQGYAIAKPLSSPNLQTWLQQPRTLPSAESKAQLTSPLALLARLLVWEEGWHMLDNAARGKEALARALWQAVPDACAPMPEVCASAKRKLIACIALGPRSTEYLQARAHLVTVLRNPPGPNVGSDTMRIRRQSGGTR
ncbi:MAG: EAL domain-containing protein [Nevskiaceae bacterium]|jgi:diguanylate cyclase (GGDEF)-like protein|nr:EAL domain-containing protein [Nevskiaceae bacterium]